MALSRSVPTETAGLDYQALGDGLMFSTEPLKAPLEITGPAAAKLFVSSSTTDTDVFIVVRLFAPDGQEIVFQGAQDPHTPIGHGWLRASHRKLDPALSTPHRPYHRHEEPLPLTPGEPVELDIEIWPTSIVAPAGYRLAINIRGCDYRYPGPAIHTPGLPYPLTGVGAFFHEQPENRPPAIFHQKARLHFVPGKQPYVLLPVIPDAG